MSATKSTSPHPEFDVNPKVKVPYRGELTTVDLTKCTYSQLDVLARKVKGIGNVAIQIQFELARRTAVAELAAAEMVANTKGGN